MEVKINREIRQYTESMFFGLSLRQFAFSLLAVGAAVALFFLFRRRAGMEAVSWICVLGAAPFAAMGFVSYNGMTAEQLFAAWLRSEVLGRRELGRGPCCYYYAALEDVLAAAEKEVYITYDEDAEELPEGGYGEV